MKLQGDLEEFSVADVAQFIGLARKTGKVEILGQDRTLVGSLFFENGEVVHATAAGATGEEAVASLFRQKEGTFQFVDGDEMPAQTVELGVQQMLLRAAQQVDEEQALLDSFFDEGLEPVERVDVTQLKQEMKQVVSRKLGKKGKRALAAIDSAGDDLGALLDACDRIERYAYLFVGHDLSRELGRELREIIGI